MGEVEVGVGWVAGDFGDDVEFGREIDSLVFVAKFDLDDGLILPSREDV